MLKVLCLVNKESFLFDLVTKICFVRFIEVTFYLEAQFSVHFTQVSDLECPLYRGDFMRIDTQRLGLNFLSALARCPH